ncbi:26S proteasome non-ATPase regulatory subunit 8 [Exaiptasia diaphana]|uniref:26S proteasome non-ATPase regulatory subunit 8 n=1 Tax=Exaiptasia diaphana TaxID=2652724 RepID=A0A913XUL2_EXADI|nr:26S proteasome non-ATPase regulatory subunit 8 [Exaiptasia diaphana]KXJ24823.1 26S proteasome non-ATPase regulatory subunit 8 [Exaiptasia diaphana]
MSSLKEVVSMYQTLIKDWNKKPVDLEKCGKLLSGMKMALIKFSFLPLPSTTNKPPQRELLLARDILEIGVQWSILKEDIPSFERYMAMLKPYYLDYRGIIEDSAYMYQLLGLNLLSLLAQNRLAEFHTELELLPAKELQCNIYIRHPISLEQYLMEGSYNKVFLARGNVPADNYHFFMNILLGTLRQEIAACIEKSYQSITFSEATRMLYFEGGKNMKEFAVKRGWTLTTDNLYVFEDDNKKETSLELPSHKMTQHMLEYAKELERIV